MKSSVTSLSRTTGTNGGVSLPTSTPRTCARNAADTCLSCAETIVWLRRTAISSTSPSGRSTLRRVPGDRRGNHDGMASYVTADDYDRDTSYLPTRIRRDGVDGYPVQPNRYRLVVSRACPW